MESDTTEKSVRELLEDPKIAEMVRQAVNEGYKRGADDYHEGIKDQFPDLAKHAAKIGYDLARNQVIKIVKEYQQSSYQAMEQPEVDEVTESRVCEVLEVLSDIVYEEMDPDNIKFPGDSGHPNNESEENHND